MSKDDPVFPQNIIERYEESRANPEQSYPVWGKASGLTKRELCALGIMIGAMVGTKWNWKTPDVVELADKLIAELERTKQ